MQRRFWLLFLGREARRGYFLAGTSQKLSQIFFLFWKELRTELKPGELSIRDLSYVFAEWQLRAGTSPMFALTCPGINDMRRVNKHLINTQDGKANV